MPRCHGYLKDLWRDHAPGKPDEELIDDIRNKERWYVHSNAEHRFYLRLLKQEAHRRGLGT